MDLGT